MARRKLQYTRDRIIRAARVLVAEKGLDRTTVAEIVAEAGVAQGTFYLYFRSKRDIAPAFLEQMLEGLGARIADQMDPARVDARDLGSLLESMVHAVYEETQSYQDVFATIFSGLAGGGDIESFRPFFERLAEPMRGLLEHGQRVGTVDTSVNAAVAARIIASTLDYLGLDLFFFKPPVSQEAYMAEVVRFLKAALGIKDHRTARQSLDKPQHRT